jgi:hypothetical protein
VAANPQTLVLSIVLHDTFNGPGSTDELRRGALRAAVHGWMEGHIEGEGRAGTPSLPVGMPGDDPMPSPPFPDRNDPRLAEILRETVERFPDGSEPLAAALFATGLAYQAGLEEGSACEGCTPRGGAGQLTDVARLRSGELPLTLRAGDLAVVNVD